MSDKATVLFVEDDENFMQALHREFRSKYHVLGVHNPDSAIDMIREMQGQIDVAVLDMWMPPAGETENDKTAGLTVVRAIKGTNAVMGLDPEIEVIILTGHESTENILECLRAGVLNYIIKTTPGWETELDELIIKAATISINSRIAKLGRRLRQLRAK